MGSQDVDPGRKPTVPETFRKLVRFLEKHRVPFVIVGGIAAGLQGEPRATADVDVMVTVRSSRIPELASAAKEEGFDIEPNLAETQWLASGFVRLWLGPPGKQVAADLMSGHSDYLKEAAWRAEHTRFCGLNVPVVTAEDLILLKLSAWREKDVPDVRAVYVRHEERLDVPYLRKWASWFASRNPRFEEMPDRLEALLTGGALPPPNPNVG